MPSARSSATGGAIVRNEAFLIDGPDNDSKPTLDWATWIEVSYSGSSSVVRTDVVHREINDPAGSAFAVWQWGKRGRFVLPIGRGDASRKRTEQTLDSIEDLATRVRETLNEWNREPPGFVVEW
jgi:hypothetical protein